MPNAKAISSFVFLSKAPSCVAAWANKPNPFITSGACVLNLAND